jgi:hypothetical protein
MESTIQFEEALDSLHEIDRLMHAVRVHPAIQRHFDAALSLLTPAYPGDWTGVNPQSVRDELLVVRELMGDEYDNLPACDRLIRYVDKALSAIPGNGQQSQAPYE